MVKVLSLAAAVTTFFVGNVGAFTQQPTVFGARAVATQNSTPLQQPSPSAQKMSFDDDFLQETPEVTKQRIQDLVDENPVLLFMKGTQLFPQCGFSSTAVQILNTFGIEFRSGL